MEFRREERQHELEIENIRLQQASALGEANIQSSSCPKMPKYVEGEDIEVFLMTFEKLAIANKWDKAIWAPRLAAVLTGKAQEAYSRLSLEDSQDYETIKVAILKKYELSAETYQRKFITCKKMSGDSHREWATRLRLLLDRWLEGEKVNTLEDLKNVIVTEQFIEMASRELQVWLREKSYKSVIEMADDADMFAQAHWKKWDDSKSRSLFQKKHISSQNVSVVIMGRKIVVNSQE